MFIVILMRIILKKVVALQNPNPLQPLVTILMKDHLVPLKTLYLLQRDTMKENFKLKSNVTKVRNAAHLM
jgi:hypothetical protein